MTKSIARTALTRRGFLKTAAAGMAGAGLSGLTLTGCAATTPGAEDTSGDTLAYTYHNEHCLCNCMFQCTVRDGKLVKIQPRPNEDHRYQNVCLKGISEIQNIYGEARIQQPMKRVGERGSGEFEAISWDEAFQMCADAFKACDETYGEGHIWMQFSTEAQQRFAPLLPSLVKAQTGIPPLNGYDMGQGNGQNQAFAWSGMFAQNTIWEWPMARTVLMVNCNVVETGMMWSRGMLDAQEAGTKIIVVDPRFSPTAAKADEWVPLTAGTDPALFMGMIHHILENDLYDREHVIAHTALPHLIDAATGTTVGTSREVQDPETGETSTVVDPYVWDAKSNTFKPYNQEGVEPELEGTFKVNGVECVTQFTKLKNDYAGYTLEWAEGITGTPAAQIAQVAEEYAKGPSIICNGVGGIDKFQASDIAGHCYALIASLTGNYGKRGTGLGIYCYHTSLYEAALGGWPLPEEYHVTAPMGFYDVVQKSDDVHAAMFFGDIPTQKAANWAKTEEWLNSLDFVALADIYKSSVMDYVDLVLPVCSKLECPDSVGGVKNANGYILQNQKVLDPLFESKSDFYIERGIAEAMGLGDLMPKDGEEYARAILTSDDPQIAGFTLEKLTEANGALKLLGSEDELGPEVGFEYHTPTGKQEPYYENMLKWGQAFPMWEEPNETYADNPLREKYPLQFGQARTRFRVHSAYSGAGWIQDLYEPHIELNPVDAAERGLSDGDQVEAFNDRGSFTTKLRVNNAIRPGSAFMAESTYRQYMDGTMMQNVTNDQLSERGYDLIFGPMIPYNDTLIEIKKVGA
ncbi:Dimethyl sulfoxide reductase DmsA precursor [Slackia heliotrinireducens]|uniref:Anaerobic dehydrogenase, typically selenocysteine-containing n=1 Tax=Slackia heliotrinireducens (strain ATCC 29202 / DSM 20476 / NCTC 11029 / RHS 1) TaxID=471855 RepID=C7N432_SLAHD|nr:molybdopterin-dependent oxidoreductase [Slackia heliotrinireducens]ACV23768.1 anaerobic dehydrogenase, typically selenocysteine-containing [Slackia heliotrinireducens DSM 20476]VEH03405.1 Dimethyl sulfoxide reductase DmsA precursor [Slackia heliotrinireducens]